MNRQINIWKNNTPLIKKILKKHFPKAKFKIKTRNSSLSKSIYIYTNLIQDYDYIRLKELELKLQNEGLIDEESKEYHEIKKIVEQNKATQQKIKTILKDFWYVDYDKFTGEILGGGNCFLFVERLDN